MALPGQINIPNLDGLNLPVALTNALRNYGMYIQAILTALAGSGPDGDIVASEVTIRQAIANVTQPLLIIDDTQTVGLTRFGRVVAGDRADLFVNLSFNGSGFYLDDTGNAGIQVSFVSTGANVLSVVRYPAGTNPRTGTNLWRVNSTGQFPIYGSVATAGWGVPAIYGYGRFTAQTGAKATVASYTVGAADGSFVVSMNVLVTTATSHNFTCTCAYTDEGNTARTVTFLLLMPSGLTVNAILNGNGAIPYSAFPLHIRAKSATTITLATTGTFTTVTYNVDGQIQQVD